MADPAARLSTGCVGIAAVAAHASRADLDHALVEAGEKFGVEDDIPVPPFWGGFRISPDFVEFWQGRPNRMHNRVRTRLVDGKWHTQRLQP